jgi:hypothetical protein
LVCGERIRSSILIHTEARNDVFGESGHLGFERLELQQEELDAGCMKFLNAAGDDIVGADETCGRSAIGSDARRLGDIVCFITTSGSVLRF